mgnify:CR=1 FL=1
MASFDRSHHGWEGVSKGGEIYGSGIYMNERSSIENMTEEAEAIEKLLGGIELEEDVETRLKEEQAETLVREMENGTIDVNGEKIDKKIEYLKSNIGNFFG